MAIDPKICAVERSVENENSSLMIELLNQPTMNRQAKPLRLNFLPFQSVQFLFPLVGETGPKTKTGAGSIPGACPRFRIPPDAEESGVNIHVLLSREAGADRQ
jgi:hypothetical protein